MDEDCRENELRIMPYIWFWDFMWEHNGDVFVCSCAGISFGFPWCGPYYV